MKTPMQELIDLIPSGDEIKTYIADYTPDSKMVEEWMYDRIFKGKNHLEAEKTAMINFHVGVINMDLKDSQILAYEKEIKADAEKYFNEKYKQ